MSRTNPAPERLQHDAGASLIEVLVALLVFAILATGIVAGMTTIARMTADNRARVTAANLAAQDMDLVRAVGTTSGITDRSEVVPVDGRNYTVVRSTAWVSQSGADLTCGSSAKRTYLRVNVRVSWPEKLPTTPDVQDDTILAAKGSTNDSMTGSIAVRVLGIGDTPAPGVAVTVTPVTGGAALLQKPDSTNANGCSVVTGVVPGTYDVTISKTGYLDGEKQAATTTQRVVVTAGTSQTPAFALYDQSVAVKVKLDDGPVNAYVGTLPLPSNLELSWWNTSGTWTTSPSTADASIARFPYALYNVVAGPVQAADGATCASTDPQNWPAATVNGVALAQGVRPTVSASAGQAVVPSVTVGVGIVYVKAPSGNSVFITQATPVAGTPSCDIRGSVYTYSKTTTGGSQVFAVPFGSWKVYYGPDAANATQVTAANLQVKSNTAFTGVASDGTVTLDPRKAK